ncbi:CLAVATA3/ESR (CLE)-related protein [Thalictrum thalictroides]|uniref:CLAVATA3/ESR (CLE)-related protein n=1 Tax=Thalictrum thalictroides TaxID=46969 RepID=A0A7J6V5G7_THATH|nr:CLAVATA3/ESR (CLE)-related protein [Thalictrum thalictroides]
MVFCSSRVLILLVCIGFLVAQPYRVSGMRSIDMVLRWDKEQGTESKTSRVSRVLSDVNSEDVQSKNELAPAPSMFNAYESSKRRVRRGSDPIHNRS